MKEITIQPQKDGTILREYNGCDGALSALIIDNVKFNNLKYGEYYLVKIPYEHETLEGIFIYDNSFFRNQLSLCGALIIID